ncbi:MAG TPA: pilus (MSHA type) biogenesis protein MshL [Deltaproteobacteria bacterium]|nr:pilus (MSHA type) biogenesis protein MshL [Deltaproteobacteria bacterium]
MRVCKDPERGGTPRGALAPRLVLLFAAAAVALGGCAYGGSAVEGGAPLEPRGGGLPESGDRSFVERSRYSIIEQAGGDEAPPRRAQAAPARPAPDFLPAAEELTPLETRRVSISARNTPLRDVLYIVAEATGLNLVMERGVRPDLPVTVTLDDVMAEEALAIILDSADYFYSVGNNVLYVKAMETKVYEFGRPSVFQEYDVSLGGDMLGAAKGTTEGIRGKVAMKVASDKEAYKFWDSLEKTLSSLIGVGPETEAPSGASAALSPSLSINRMSGTIIVTATRNGHRRVETYLDRLKRIFNRQVMIEARIIEVQLSDGLKYGIDWSFLAAEAGGTHSNEAGMTLFTDVTGSLPTLNFSLSAGDFNTVIKALRQQGEVNVLSNPRLNILNGQTALLSVGRKVDFISKVQTYSTGVSTQSVPTVTFTVETSSVLSGIIFGIVPYIDSDTGEISMTITPIVSDLVKFDDKRLGQTGSDTVEISLPTIDLREMSTTVKVRDGEMVVIGGLIQDSRKTFDNRVPYISDIPWIGDIFKSRDKRDVRTELVLMLRPTIEERGGVSLSQR